MQRPEFPGVLAALLVFVALALIAAVILAAAEASCGNAAAWYFCRFAVESYGTVVELQSGLGAFLGLIGLLAGALYNAHLTREREYERWLTDTHAFSAAIAAELTVILKSLERTIELLGEYPELVEHINLDEYDLFPEEQIFPANAHRLGQLGPDAAEAIAYFYARYSTPNFGSVYSGEKGVAQILISEKQPTELKDSLSEATERASLLCRVLEEVRQDGARALALLPLSTFRN